MISPDDTKAYQAFEAEVARLIRHAVRERLYSGTDPMISLTNAASASPLAKEAAIEMIKSDPQALEQAIKDQHADSVGCRERVLDCLEWL